MPKVQRKDIPRAILEHLLQRIAERSIDSHALKSLAVWLDTNPEVPAGDWFKRFPSMPFAGRGVLIKTFLTPSQVPIGTEL